ncbi:unnamed protein product [Brassicogethes aeneus]|uniref:Serine/threonine-protein kinase ATR n=1 Tax=Brassicogethes aeneus TaxID=1431903 RepID=A0A9P0FR90_BRAAE|nr:unnamed protein product [Brassicogethes aeneus]
MPQTLEEIIPAFSTWKMINETVPDLLKDCSEGSLKRLANIIQSKEHSNIFIYDKDPNLSYENYEDIINKYKAFTTWLLGQLLYVISCEKVSKIHDLIVKTQLTILDSLSKTHLNVYSELASEYAKTLELLVNICISDVNNNKLEVFIPKVHDDLKKLYGIFDHILVESFTFFSFDESTTKILHNLTYLLSMGPFSIKTLISNTYVSIIEKTKSYHDDYSFIIVKKVMEMASLFEQTIYDVYNVQNKTNINKNDLKKFGEVVEKYFNVCHNFDNVIIDNKSRISMFVYKKSLENQENLIPDNVLKSCVLNIKSLPVNFGKIEDLLGKLVDGLNYYAFVPLKNIILANITDSFKRNTTTLKAYENCSYIGLLQELILQKLNKTACTKNLCNLTRFLTFFNNICNMLIEIKIKSLKTLKNVTIIFFDEKRIFLPIINAISRHSQGCTQKLDQNVYLKYLLNVFFATNSNNLDIIFTMITHPLLKPLVYKNDNNLPDNFIGVADINEFKKGIRAFYVFLGKEDVDKTLALTYLGDFLTILSSSMVGNLNDSQVEHIQRNYAVILKNMVQNNDPNIALCLKAIPHIFSLFSNAEEILLTIVIPILANTDKNAQKQTLDVLPNIFCECFHDYLKIIYWNDNVDELSIEIYCEKCYLDHNIEEKSVRIKDFVSYRFKEDSEAICFKKNRVDIGSVTGTLLKHVIRLLTTGTSELKVGALGSLPNFSNHVVKFHSVNVFKLWLETCGDHSKEVRLKFKDIIYKTLIYGQDNTVLSDDIKKETLEIIFSVILKFSKKSLQFSDLDLQETLLDTIDEISNIKTHYVQIESLKILLYFIIVPTSRLSLIAINKCFKIAEKRGETTKTIFSQNKREFCEVVAHLCCVNQALINSSLSSSLGKCSVMFGFCGPKDFVSQSLGYMLPFVVAKVVEFPKVARLIEEYAEMVDMDVAELLASKYGNIFLHVFLNDRDHFEEISSYLERTTGSTGPALRKRNFRVILNELLMNFHEKRERVLLALRLLSMEDNENTSKNIPDYLQSLFLGVLQYFDVKLLSKKDNVLLSLAELFKFMGSKHITPLKFKIIAMLQSGKYSSSPKLNCEVWDAFISSCDIESLGPQLATIFVSILPLVESCPKKVNEIFKYLIVDNEVYTRDYIPDLFFVNNANVDKPILSQIKKHLKCLEQLNLKEKIKRFLKYLKHETNEVRIQALKHLKVLMEQNREELDQMILGYNGIDQVIVDLIDILMLACREKDSSLKLACGNVIAELGAVEPSHLPRRYAQDSKSFSFFIHEDSFIVNTLNELTKAFQAEKNTQSMDRFALAIQEILKSYEISPEENSAKSRLWRQFPESQQELMLPLLSSRYMMAPSEDPNFTYPIYGSNVGMSFDSWLNNWTYSLILSLPNEIKTLLLACSPSMKQDHRILIHFLPYILLHSLLEGSNDIQEKCVVEFQAVTNAFKIKKELNHRILNARPLPIPGMEVIPQVITPEEVKQLECTKVVFLLLDFLDRWLREWMWLKGQSGNSNENYQALKNFQNRFCNLHLAKCNYHCAEYPRALMYLEDYITKNPKEKDNHLSFLAEIYAQLDEPDGVAGVTALQQKEPSVEERILSLEVAGKLADAAACYERMTPPLKLHHLQGLVQCYLDLDNVNTALNFAQGAVNLQPEFGNMLLEMQAEPLWRLGRYDDLDKFLNKDDMVNNNSWGVNIGRSLLHVKNGKRDLFNQVIDEIKIQQVESLGASSMEMGVYQRGYSYISRLHAINELEQVEKCINELLLKPNDKNYAEAIMKKLSMEWELRIKVVQESIRIIEPVLCLRRAALNMGKSIIEEKAPVGVKFFNALLGESWLMSAKTARSAGIHQQAYTYTIKAEEYAPQRLFLEKAKLHWLREEHEQALTTLKRGLELVMPETGSTQAMAALSLEQKKICAEAMLLTASYNDSISNVDTEINVQYYKESFETYKEWEKSLVCLAQYYDRIFQTHSDEERDTKCASIQLHMINYFLKSLQFGTEFIYQSLPRILSIWFDFGTRLLDVTSNTVKEERKNMLFKMTKLIDDSLKRLPAYIFLTAFSQIISRICHPQKEVHQELKSIIIKLLQHYPQQCLWMIISVVKSSYAIRSKRCMEILNDSNLKTGSMLKLVKDFTSLAEKLIELCNKEIPADVSSTKVSQLLRALPRMLTKSDFSEIMMPTQKFRKLVLPNPDFKSSQHNPFPNFYVHIAGIEDEVSVLASLQRPRKITLRGSDGKGYIYMLKPKDDLRKDFRLMEFNDIVNQLLSREPEARQRRLNIRLYSVAPLNEECGLIEWVNNLVGLRPILVNLYKQKGMLVRNKELNEMKCNLKDSLVKKREVFLKLLLPKHPPVLGEWFRKTFPDTQNWLTARTAYTRTTAVMSIAGYILGLGDRHGENIQLDSTCGDTVHVDFNCLFNKGEAFEWPERVPFRLTQNMVSAMGPLGVEGVFRKSCACTLRVLRNNTNTLMSIVTPFVYDPLVSWPRNAASSHSNAERTNEQAVEHVKNIELRLQGIIKTKNRSFSIPLSVEGQTNNLINEAISVDNLCQMYIGWGPYM